MKPCARRITIAAAVLGVAVVAVLVVAHWDTFRDHVVAWHFQATRETATIELDPAFKELSAELLIGGDSINFGRTFLQMLASHWSHPVVFYPPEMSVGTSGTLSFYGVDLTGTVNRHVGDVEGAYRFNFGYASPQFAKQLLTANGWRVIEQRFPRRAYVVIRGNQ